MSDIIQLLPDSVANQIAAGEVVQRPASVVKELVENAIDAGADHIKVIIKDAGKTLIQVIDNGCGMSETDARMAFERHATSKIRKADDLFSIRTMGFRGEALASICAISHVEMKTRRHEDQTGHLIQIDGNELISAEPCACPAGSSFSIKHLFYNVPARRHFLKSNPVEMRHIIDEFQRIAIANPHVFLNLHHDGNELFHLPKANLKQRLVHLFGNNYNERLVPVEESASVIKLKGFIGKPEFARKTRGEQYFFVNNRFIKSSYLNHAVAKAYEKLIAADVFPLYVLFIDMDPTKIDINVHPTKTEIKFEDERMIYAIIQAGVRGALGRSNLRSGMDFEIHPLIKDLIPSVEQMKIPEVKINPDFNPFIDTKPSPKINATEAFKHLGVGRLSSNNNWERLYKITQEEYTHPQSHPLFEQNAFSESKTQAFPYDRRTFQLHQSYILSPIKSGFILIDQQRAHERIIYERYLEQLNTQKASIQRSMFPQSMEIPPADFELIRELMPDFHSLGFDIREFGKNTIIIEGTPADLTDCYNEKELLENILESYKKLSQISGLKKREHLARSTAKHTHIKRHTALSVEEMGELIDQLFACEMPAISLSGKSTFLTITLDELVKRLDNKASSF